LVLVFGVHAPHQHAGRSELAQLGLPAFTAAGQLAGQKGILGEEHSGGKREKGGDSSLLPRDEDENCAQT